MTIHEFGQKNEKVLVLIHPSVVMWDYSISAPMDYYKIDSNKGFYAHIHWKDRWGKIIGKSIFY
jgi:hypothetical protein